MTPPLYLRQQPCCPKIGNTTNRPFITFHLRSSASCATPTLSTASHGMADLTALTASAFDGPVPPQDAAKAPLGAGDAVARATVRGLRGVPWLPSQSGVPSHPNFCP